MTRRRAFSLVEVLVVITVGTAMLMIATSVLYMLKETESGAARRLSEGRRVTRLIDQFREDAHAARSVQPAADAAEPRDSTAWEFALAPDTAVRYELRSDRVRRMRTSGNDKIHEDYRLPSGIRVRIQAPEPGSSLVTLQFTQADGANTASRPLACEALLGYDHRHEAPVKEGAE